MEEIFKDIPGYDGLYQVSNLGNVKSLPREVRCGRWTRITKERILKNCKDIHGYFLVNLSQDGILKTRKIHQLVAIAFLNHTPCGHKIVVDHINDNKKDNRLENLQIITQRENAFKTQGNYSSQYKGVCWDKSRNKWMSQIKINGKKKHLGYFEKECEASVAYQNKLLSLSN